MRKITKIASFIIAIALMVTSFATFFVKNEIHVHAAGGNSTVATGTVYTVKKSAIGTTNVNGQFTIGFYTRPLPTITGTTDAEIKAQWNNYFNMSSAASIGNFVGAVVKNAEYYNPAYVNTPSNDAAQDKIGFYGDGDFHLQVSSRDLKIFRFKAPASGTYTFSFTTKTFYGAAVFTSIGNTDINFKKQLAHNSNDSYAETIYLNEGEYFNIGFTRVTGSYYDNPSSSSYKLTPVEDDVAFRVQNFKVTYDGAGYVDGATFDFKNSIGATDTAPFSFYNYNYSTGSLGNALSSTNATVAAGGKLAGFTDVKNAIRYGTGNPSIYRTTSNFEGVKNDSHRYVGDVWGQISTTNSIAIVFSAPVAGEYDFSYSISRFYGPYGTDPVAKNSAAVVLVGYEKTKLSTTANAQHTAFTVSDTGVFLNKGETIIFYVDALGDGSADEYSITGATVQLKSASLYSYNFHEEFENKTVTRFGNGHYGFSVGNRTVNTNDPGLTGIGNAFRVFDKIANPSTECDGYPVVDNAHANAMHIGYYAGSSLNASRGQHWIWAGIFALQSAPSVIKMTPHGTTETVIAFTAPACGDYTFDVEVAEVWNNDYESRFYVEVDGVIHNNFDKKFTTGTTPVRFTDTVTLKKGESIYFVYNPIGNSSGDAIVLNHLAVSTDEVVHAEGTDMTHDATGHWTAYTCCGEATTEKAAHDNTKIIDNGNNLDHSIYCSVCDRLYKDAEAHVWNALTGTCTICSVTCQHDFTNGKCNICAYEYCDHYLVGQWTTTATSHTYTYPCCNKPVVNNLPHKWNDDKVCADCGYECQHVFEGSCAENGVCKYCGLVSDEKNGDEHTGKVVYTATAEGHTGKYDCCGATVVENGEHRFYNSECLVCEYVCNHGGDLEGECDICNYNCVHEGGKATCESGALCTKCGVEYTDKDPENHACDIEWVSTRTKHYSVYGCNGEKATLSEKHYGGEGTCVTGATCDVCGAEYGEMNADNHEGEVETIITETTHAKKYTCCGAVVLAEEAHKGGEATCTAKAVCEVCGVEYGEMLAHDYTEATCTELATCKACGATTGELKAHDYTEATCTELATCKACGATTGELKAHEYTEATCTELATCKACGATTGELKAHDYTEATCTEKAACKVCGAETGDLKPHNYKDGNCVDCDAKDPNYVAPNPGTSDRTVSVALMIAAMAFLGYALIPSKKRHTAE